MSGGQGAQNSVSVRSSPLFRKDQVFAGHGGKPPLLDEEEELLDDEEETELEDEEEELDE